MAALLVIAPLLVTASVCLAVRLEGGMGGAPRRATELARDSVRGRHYGPPAARPPAARACPVRPSHCRYRKAATALGVTRPAVTGPAARADPAVIHGMRKGAGAAARLVRGRPARLVRGRPARLVRARRGSRPPSGAHNEGHHRRTRSGDVPRSHPFAGVRGQ